ncbi:MAG: hypothetical protein J4G12_08290 [Gemmatimonadetes bacterium]|nr:hypothetical protein [Gemmatimonadota bacterium]
MRPLVESCVAQLANPAGRCGQAAVAALESVDQVTFLSGFGTEIPGSASTLGMRFGRSSRVAAWLRTGAASASLPTVLARDGGTRASSFIVPAARLGIASGVWDGLRIAPTLWGLFSIDLIAEGGVTRFPTGKGYEGWVTGFGLGARIGVLRESFTVPGITLSARRQYSRTVRLGDGDSAAEISSLPRVTALRATMGKDLVALGIVVGVGLDLYDADLEMRVDDARTEGSISGDRRLYFGGLSWNFLFIQLSAEAGLAEGMEEISGSLESWAPEGRATFLSLAIRLTI